MSKIYVTGVGFRPLGKKASYVLLHSDVVLASNRLLNVFRNYKEYEGVKDRIIVHGSVYETLDYIADNYKTKKISLLAAGDPMFFGIGRLVVERLGPEAVEVFPDLSSMQVAFSRVRETSNNALLISLHGGPDPAKRRKLEYELSDLPSLIQRHGKIGILTDKENNPSAIASMVQSSMGNRSSSIKIFVCEKLGYDDEKVYEGTPGEIAGMMFEHPNVVIVKSEEARMRESDEKRQRQNIIFGLREADIKHSKGLITKDEVRAVAVHKLRLPERGVLWDIGAGSGSVSLEAAGICPLLHIYAVEKKKELVDIIQENRDAFEAHNINTIAGDAPDALDNLPEPDRVFVGGSGGNMSGILQLVSKKMTSGIIVINATTIETLNEAVQALEKNGFSADIAEISVSRSKLVGDKKHMSALNPIFIITGERIQ